MCIAKSDITLTHRIRWYKDDKLLENDSRVRWVRAFNKLIFDPADTSDTGNYKCEAYTPLPFQSKAEARASVMIRGPPEPPTEVKLTGNCLKDATLSWKPNPNDNNSPVLRHDIEYTVEGMPGQYYPLESVTSKTSKSKQLDISKLPGSVRLFFRVRAVNAIGVGEPSELTKSLDCRTPPERAPIKFPDNFRGSPTTANKLDVVWDPFTYRDVGGRNCRFVLSVHHPVNGWSKTSTENCFVSKYTVPDPGVNQEWKFKIQAVNDIGSGPESTPVLVTYSGRDRPRGRPSGLTVVELTPTSVKLDWDQLDEVDDRPDSGYRLYVRSESLLPEEEQRGNPYPEELSRYRRALQDNGTRDFKAPPATVENLSPYTRYVVQLKAFNSGGEGPPSSPLRFNTPQGRPSPPVDFLAFPFAYYIMVRWNIPRHTNGPLEGYTLDIYPRASDGTEIYNVGPDTYEHVFSDLQPVTFYNSTIFARNLQGPEGLKAYAFKIHTISPDRPFQPQPPFVEGISTSAIRVRFRVGFGGGFPREFNIKYRTKAAEGEEKAEWISLSKQEYLINKEVEIQDLEYRVYEFVSIGYNGLGESVQSEIAEGRPLREPATAARTAEWYDETWFIILVVILLLLALVLLLLFVATRKRGAKYPVGKRERDKANKYEVEPPEDTFPLKEPTTEEPPPYESEASKSERDSLDDYGEAENFDEDGSFIGEYNEDRKKGGRDEPATFV